jgi:hypothetical protein
VITSSKPATEELRGLSGHAEIAAIPSWLAARRISGYAVGDFRLYFRPIE